MVWYPFPFTSPLIRWPCLATWKENYFAGDGKGRKWRKAYPRKREDAINEWGTEKHREHLAAFWGSIMLVLFGGLKAACWPQGWDKENVGWMQSNWVPLFIHKRDVWKCISRFISSDGRSIGKNILRGASLWRLVALQINVSGLIPSNKQMQWYKFGCEGVLCIRGEGVIVNNYTQGI